MSTSCEQLADDLAGIVDGDPHAIARHADHLAGCDACRDLRHDATLLGSLVARAGGDHVPRADLVDRVLAQVTASPVVTQRHSEPARPDAAPHRESPRRAAAPRSRKIWLAVGAGAALAAGAVGIVTRGHDDGSRGIARKHMLLHHVLVESVVLKVIDQCLPPGR